MRYRMASFLPLPVRLTAGAPATGTFQMSQPSDSSTRAAVLRPAERRPRRLRHVVVVFRVDERRRDQLGQVRRLARRHVVDEVVPVLVVVELRPVGGRLPGVSGLLERQLAVARLHVDDVDVLVAAAVEVAHQLVLADVVADGELLLRRGVHAPHGVVGQADELVLPDPVDGQVAEVLVHLLLHLLLRLQARVLVVPEHEVHLLVLRRLGAGGAAGASGFAVGSAPASPAWRRASRPTS